jgi:gliding motility-associated-like protein
LEKIAFVCIFEIMPKFTFIIAFISILCCNNGFSQEQQVITPHVNPSLRFTENLGQWDKNILFSAQMDGGAMFIEPNCLSFNFYDKRRFRELHLASVRKEKVKPSKIKGHAFKVYFEGSNPNPKVESLQQGTDYENFLLGSDKTKWKSNVKNYHQVWLRDLYPKIDYEIFSAVNGFKYNFHVKPGANPNLIKLRYKGVDKLRIKDSALIIKLAINQVIEHKPYVYQIINGNIKTVECVYKLVDDVLSFEFPKGYNKNAELIIDPVLVFSAQIGVTPDNFGMTATFDAAGNLYSGGMVFNVGYATTTGAYDLTFNNIAGYGRSDVFITKYNSTGNALIYSTYIGGSGTEVASSLIVDNNNNLCLYGATSSPDFPMLSNSAYPTFNGGQTIGFTSNGSIFCGGTDIYISKLSANGQSLIASTFYGGTGNDGVNYLTVTYNDFVDASNNPCITNFPSTNYDSLQTNYGDQFRGEIQIDALNNIYVASSTRSGDIPIQGGFDNSINGGQDAIVAKFNSNLSGLLYSSFIGGSQNDCGNGLYVNKSFEVFVTGGTCSNNLPNTSGGHLSTYQGGKTDGFLYKINAAGNTVINATYIGTNNYDNSFFVSGDKNGKIYVFGQSYGNMPVQAAPTSTNVYSVPNTHQFVIEYRSTLNSIYMATVFGTKLTGVDISPSAFAVDNCNNIYLSGWGGGIITNTVAMSNMPILNPVVNPVNNYTFSSTAGYDFYLMALDSNATNLVFGSYFGGNSSQEHVDGGTSRFDPTGKIYQSVCAGCNGADDFPLSPNAWPCPSSTNCPNQNPSGNCNNGVFKINFGLNMAVSAINTNTLSGCSPLTVNFTNVYTPTVAGSTFTWNYGNGQTNTTVVNPVFTYTNPGTYTVTLVVFDPSSCNKTDSSKTIIQVLPLPNTAFTASFAPCGSTVATTNNSTGTLTSNPFVWNWGDSSPTTTLTSPSHTYASSGIYTITLTTTGANGCTSSTTRTVSIFYFSPSVSPGLICEGAVTTITASGGTSYSWTPSTGLSNPSISNPAASPTTTTIYTVTITHNGSSPPCVQDLTTTVIVNPKPNAGFNYSINPCGGGVNFYDVSTASITAWNWSLQPLPVITSTLQDPYHFYPNGGTFTVSLIVSNQYGCLDTSRQVLIVPVPPPLSINAATTICKGNGAQLFASGGTSYSWSPGATLSATNIANPIATPTISTGYSVVVTTSNNCNFLLVTSVMVTYLSNSPISATASPTRIVQGNTTSLVYTGDPGALVTWAPSTFVNPKTGYSVTAQPDRPTTYTVIATNGPCKETLLVFVDVVLKGCEEGDAFVPNTFTPNGDGQNDVLYARGLKMEEIYFAVYNRWGEKVFDTYDKKVGWDGIYKGRPADVGVFGWYLKVKCYDGTETFKKGNVTLIR